MARGANATTGNIGTGENGKIELKDVYDNFKKYNFIINLQGRTIDTTDFFGCGHASNSLFDTSNVQPAGVQTILRDIKKGLVLYNIKPGGSEGNANDITEIVVLPEILDKGNGIDYSIQVKSKRNFLLNQKHSNLLN